MAVTTTTLVPGAHQDPADLWGILLAVAVIAAAIGFVRVVFRSRR